MKTEGKCKAWKYLEVTIHQRNRRRMTSGCAYVGTGPIHLSISEFAHVKNIVKTFYHELMHVYGYKSHRGGQCDPRPADMKTLLLGLPEKPPGKQLAEPAKRDIIGERYANMVARKKTWISKQKRAENALKKVRQQIKDYRQRYPERFGT